jgi:hypothetical protein
MALQVRALINRSARVFLGLAILGRVVWVEIGGKNCTCGRLCIGRAIEKRALVPQLG